MSSGAGPSMRCKLCQQENPAEANYCMKCGSVLQSALKDLHAERRQLSVMFCDLVGSTPLSQQLDPEDLREVIRRYQDVCGTIVAASGGYVAQYLGDGLLIYFGYPEAHEDDAHRAVRAGLLIVEAMQRLNSDARIAALGLPQPLQVRVSAHTDLVIIGDDAQHTGSRLEPEPVIGSAKNIAARIQQTAKPNTFLISPATYRLVEGFFDCRALGLHALRGVKDPIALFEVLAERRTMSRFDVARMKGLTPLVSRQTELAALRQHWMAAMRGRGRSVALEGEAGIGKSRLVHTLKDEARQAGAQITELRCSSHHKNSPFSPVIDLLANRALGFIKDDSHERKLEKVAAFLERFALPVEDAVPMFCEFLSLPVPEPRRAFDQTPQRKRQMTMEALVHILRHGSEEQPVLLVVEDLHWIDPSTLELLTLVVGSIERSHIMVVTTQRPDFRHVWPEGSSATQLCVTALSAEQTETMIRSVPGGSELPENVVKQLVAKTDGVPLFIEESTRMLVKVRETRAGAPAASAKGTALNIPETLKDMLTERLYKLPDPARQTAQLAAALARQFSRDLIAAVASLQDDALDRELQHLVEADILLAREGSGGTTYSFKHALIQDAAYESLLKTQQQRFHRQIADVMQRELPEVTEAQPELLAHHLTRAGSTVEAVPVWRRAGYRAVERSANEEAIDLFKRALGLLLEFPESPERMAQELEVQIALGVPVIATKGFASPDVERAYGRARELCRELGDTPNIIPALLGMGSFFVVRAELATARDMAEQVMRLARQSQDSTFILAAHAALGATTLWQGHFETARQHLEQAVERYDPAQHGALAFLYGQDWGIVSLSHLALALWMLGYPAEARRRSEEALQLSRQLSHAFSQVYAVNFASWVRQLLGDVDRTRELALDEIAAAEDRGFPLWIAAGHVLVGWTSAKENPDQGLERMHAGLAAWVATGAELARTYFRGLLAEVYIEAGMADEALREINQGLTEARVGAHFYDAELYRLKGMALLSASAADSDAEASFLQSLDVAHSQGARALELRASVSLARLWQRQARGSEARDMVERTLARVEKTCEGADLEQAKELLATLQ